MKCFYDKYYKKVQEMYKNVPGTVKLEMFAHNSIREFRGWCKNSKFNGQQTLIANDK